MVLAAMCVVLSLVVLSMWKKLRALKQRFSTILSADEESARIINTARQKLMEAEHDSSRILATAQSSLARLQVETAAEIGRREALNGQYANAKSIYERLSQEVRSLEENLEDISFGLYKPHYAFDAPEAFKRELEKVVDQQKSLVHNDQAVICAVAWTVSGSEREGARMQKQYAKLVLRAFNGECDAAIAKVTWSNATKMEERIQKAFDGINKLGEVMQISISMEYRRLKLAELRLEHEMEDKKRSVGEEQRQIREQMRDEERAQREAAKAQVEAETDEQRFAKALEKVRVEFAKSKGQEHARLSAKILELEQNLEEARIRGVRAKSMAELTKVGYVYVISNIGSFGEGVLKIGMTRRLEPMDRVRELGDSSVPFPFDVHAMVYSKDAPALENTLHRHFAARSVNLVNMRKEFFQVDLAELEQFATQNGLAMSFTKVAEARDYRESMELRRNRDRRPAASAAGNKAFPDSLNATMTTAQAPA